MRVAVVFRALLAVQREELLVELKVGIA